MKDGLTQLCCSALSVLLCCYVDNFCAQSSVVELMHRQCRLRHPQVAHVTRALQGTCACPRGCCMRQHLWSCWYVTLVGCYDSCRHCNALVACGTSSCSDGLPSTAVKHQAFGQCWHRRTVFLTSPYRHAHHTPTLALLLSASSYVL
jgi:hypothetical protein